jgi:hypothetical protein
MAPDQDSALAPAAPTFDTHDALRIALVWAALLMNFGLALVNANVAGMNPTIVLAAQLALTAAAAVVILLDPPRVSPSFVIAILVVLLGYLLAGLFHQKLEPRGLYDVLVIPIFMLLGMTLHQLRAWMINIPMVVITLVGLADGLLRDQFATIVNPLSYYRATRLWVAAQDSAFSEDNGLYVGADRAGGLVFSFISDHRVGSIFLEPLSLAYFAVVATIVYAIVYRNQRGKFLAGGAACLFLALLADTRTAAFIVFLSIVATLFVKHVPRILVFLVPVAIITLGGLIYLMAGEGETAFRLSLTYDAFMQMDSLSFLLGDVTSEQMSDSGLIEVIHNVGVVSAVVVIYLVSGILSFEWRRYSIVPLLAIIYVMVTLLFGGAVFSIKTAALFGFMLGASGCRSGFAGKQSMAQGRPVLHPPLGGALA